MRVADIVNKDAPMTFLIGINDNIVVVLFDDVNLDKGGLWINCQ